MKKSFPMTDPVHQPARVVESIKSDIRKYLKRERKKKLPEGVDFWDFACRVGENGETAEAAHVAEINQKIDAAATNEWTSVYIEILAKPGIRSGNQSKASTIEQSKRAFQPTIPDPAAGEPE